MVLWVGGRLLQPSSADPTRFSSQVHDGRGAAGARGREEEGAAQVVAEPDGQPVSQQCFHAAAPRQRKPHPSRHTTHHTLIVLSQQHTNRYERVTPVVNPAVLKLFFFTAL